MSAMAAVCLRTITVGVGDLVVSADPAIELVTYALGSCLGVIVHDPVASVGGLLHVMLPSSSIAEGEADPRHERYVDTGVPMLFRSCYELGAQKSRMTVRVVGGSSSTAGDSFEIGKRNLLAVRKLLWKNGVLIEARETGGVGISRTVGLEIGTGRVWLRAGATCRVL